MTTHTQNRGFTLIELLVVIAIIGILASVVLASLNSARDKGADAAAKSNINNSRAEAELFYDNANRSYLGVCALTGSAVIGDGILAAAASVGASYTVSNSANLTATVAVCHDTALGWAAATPLKGSTTQGWCADSTGYTGLVNYSALDTDNDITCN